MVGDFAIVKGWKADRYGNVVYRDTAQNFNPLAATAGRVTVVEVEEIVEPGELRPDQIHTPGIYVDRIIQGTFEKRIEKRTVHEG
ncbi:putative succinyl-CoA:3-ketoacid coenzyme A transferase subunit A [Halomonas elongata]|uniref:Putative succinyl-CoA:3-ketoacid coenzyme A transferase subunit A n=1 Tax=Halomonas elongata TaxID=2746 RepID=A0A1B8P2G7_HALEL|nr:putative succinyl-CoA:3-ketoacid coenzyme A transferase subunit A [Halomonas elongata]